MKTVGNLTRQIRQALRTINYNNYSDSIPDALELAKEDLFTHILPTSLIRDTKIENGVFEKETYFEAPLDMNSDYVIHIRKTDSDRSCDLYDRVKDYDVSSGNNPVFDVERVNGYKYIRFHLPTQKSICSCKKQEDSCLVDFASAAGWDVEDGITALYSEPNPVTGRNDLVFNMKTTGSIKKYIDLHLDPKKTHTMWVDLSRKHRVSTLEITLGDDSSNYTTYTVNKRHNGNGFINGLQLIALPQGATTGLPSGAHKFIKIKINMVNGQSNPCKDGECEPIRVRIGCLASRSTESFNIKYYSSFIFRNPLTDNWLESVPQHNNSEYGINLEGEEWLMYYHLVVSHLKFNNANNGVQYDMSVHLNEINRIKQMYYLRHPNLVKKPSHKAPRSIRMNPFLKHGF